MSTTDRTEPTRTESPAEQLQDLPPSSKLVYTVLEREGRLSQGRIAEETLLPKRTVRDAVARLEEIGAVESQFAFSDARKRLYRVREEFTA